MDDMVVPHLDIDSATRVRMRLALEMSVLGGVPYEDKRVADALERTVDALVQDAVNGGAPMEFGDALRSLATVAVENESVSMYVAFTGPDDAEDDSNG